ncbi:MAG: lipid-A-disaccharide synthase [Bacteroidales bacterium]|jgi:lipid-A-disaccharide synthase|nr:lipid-A-disaccharide synthase [Bacteroidales bacterium]
MKLYIIAGEASGDLHGSNLVRELKRLKPNIEIRGWGGDLMEKEGVELRKHYRDLAFMGFVEVINNLRTVLRNLDFCKKDILEFKPDAVVLIDYPGVNLRIAEWAKKQGIKVIYYIAPQVWAWHKSRVKLMRKYIDKLLVILPFEKDFFAKHGMDAEFVGHPLLDAIVRNAEPAYVSQSGKPIIAILPGSRRQEIQTILPIQLSVIPHFLEYEFVIAGTEQHRDLYKKIIGNQDVRLVFNQTYPLLRSAKAALVKSGTSTLETALFEVPEVVCYKGNPLSYLIAKNVVDIKYISLVNLIMDKPVVSELIQNKLNTENLVSELKKCLSLYRETQISDYKLLKQKLGESNASLRAAETILDYLK